MAFTGAYSSSERNEICRLIRSCYGVSAHEAVRLMRLYSDNLDAVLDTLGESDDSPPVSQMAFDPAKQTKFGWRHDR